MGAAGRSIECKIPYERQSRAESNRTCGAACLSMVYRSFGKVVAQDEIWEAIAKVNPFGSLASTTHLMVRDALRRGFDAVALRARHPLFVLRCCRDADIRVILNHRLHATTGDGHYSVLVDVDDHDVILHDPYFGPSRRLSHSELRELWEPGAKAEIVGQTLIAIGREQPTPAACEICQTPIPAAVQCPQCAKAVGLRPATGIGCVGAECIVRKWLTICCPSCDYMWNFAATAPAAAESAPPKAAEQEDTFQLGKVFAGLDKFCAAIAAMPLAASNREVMKQIECLKGGKEKLTQAAAKELATLRAHRAMMADLVQKSRQAKEANRKRQEALNEPSTSLDGNALSRALLKNLGLIR